MAIAVVVVDERRDGREDVGVAVGAIAFAVFSAPDIIEVPLQIAQDDEIEKAIVVEIDPCGGGGPSAAGRAGFLGYIGKGSVAVVVIETVATVSRDVEIFIAVVIVIAHGDTHAIADALQAGLFGDVFEGAILLLMKEAIPIFGAVFCGIVPFGVGSASGAPLTKKMSSSPSLS